MGQLDRSQGRGTWQGWLENESCSGAERTNQQRLLGQEDAPSFVIEQGSYLLIYTFCFVLLQECDFVKLRDDSYLRVVYMGNIRIQGCTNCCKRWYFTFNKAECTDPAPIDGALYQGTNVNIHRPTNIEGYCGGIDAGKVRVGFSAGNCKVPFNTNGDAYTGSNQANRIIIEEVEPPVA